jgi:predicted transposase YbfD/YdcC
MIIPPRLCFDNYIIMAFIHRQRFSSTTGGRQVSIDGKAICGRGKEGDHKAAHMVRAWVNENNMVLGQLATEEKRNEITAIPELLDLIDVSGDTITIDAAGCQKEIVKKIRAKGADYVLAVKENQPVLCEEIKEYFAYLDDQQTKELPEDVWESGVEKGHGRIEQRRIRTVTDIGFSQREEGLEGPCDHHRMPGKADGKGRNDGYRPVFYQQ